MHTHIDQRARLPEDCPTCKKVWDILARKSVLFNVRKEIVYARTLRDEYGIEEMLNFLTDTRELGLHDTWKTKL